MRYAIITSGHSGSTWLRTALHRPAEGIAVFHEPIVHILGPLLYAIQAAGARPPMFPRRQTQKALGPYVEWARHRELQFEAVGEIHTELGEWWPQVRGFLPEKRTMTVRHGIQVVHSWFQLRERLPEEWNPSTRPMDEVVAPPGLENAPPGVRLFAYLCVRWSQQVELLELLGPMKVYRLEELTTDSAALRQLCRESTGKDLTPEECVAIQGVVINRKVMGDRSPENLFWNVWDDMKRELFSRYCGSALEHFGYSIPAKNRAPRNVDVGRAPARHNPEDPLGPFAPLWVFASNPSDFPVLVYGADHRTPLAAELLMQMGRPAVYLFHDREQTWRACPQGFQAVTIDQASQLCPGGIFIADDSPPRSEVDKLRALFPGAEIVNMLSLPLTAEQRQRRWDSERPGGGECVAPAAEQPQNLQDIERSGSSEFLAFGPFQVGEHLTPDWRVVSLRAGEAGLQLCLCSDQEEPLYLDLKPDLQGQHSPFPVAEGGLHYRSTEIEFSRIAPVCEIVARCASDALAGDSLARVLQRWRDRHGA